MLTVITAFLVFRYHTDLRFGDRQAFRHLLLQKYIPRQSFQHRILEYGMHRSVLVPRLFLCRCVPMRQSLSLHLEFGGEYPKPLYQGRRGWFRVLHT